MTDGPDAKLPRGQTLLPPLVEVHFDGACQPPGGGGVAAYGFVIDGAGLHHEEHDLAVRPWSAHATNNVAEYTGAIRALEWLRARGYRGQVILFGDSQLVIRQMQGEYLVRAAHLRSYWDRLQQLAKEFPDTRFVWVPREENARADELSKLAIEEAWASAGRHRPAIPPVVVEEDAEPSPGDRGSGPN